jgi:ATP-dependent DNA ligase
MVPTLVREPFHRDGWVYEEKVDGWRIVAYKDGDRVRLLSRHGVDHTNGSRMSPAPSPSSPLAR